jgi:hypothetical protein
MKAMALLALFLTGCATTAVGPNGRAFHHIEAFTTASAYNKAAAKCPNGYDVISTRQQGLFAVLDVECR